MGNSNLSHKKPQILYIKSFLCKHDDGMIYIILPLFLLKKKQCFRYYRNMELFFLYLSEVMMKLDYYGSDMKLKSEVIFHTP
jgi:hypothetical protein